MKVTGPRLTLQVLRRHENRCPYGAKPFHADGGDWTFLDLALAGSSVCALTVGLHDGEKIGASRFGNAQLSVPSKWHGAPVVNAFGRAFGYPVPRARSGGELEPLSLSREEFFGDGRKVRENHYQPGGGAVSVSRVTAVRDGLMGELYFIYDRGTGMAEFARVGREREGDFFSLLLTLRDGFPTPEAEPGRKQGPECQAIFNLIADRARVVGWRPDEVLLVHEREGEVLSFAFATGAPERIARADGAIVQAACTPNGRRRCVIIEAPSRERPWPDSSERYIWVDDEGVSARLPELTSPGLPTVPFSPDGRHLAVLSQATTPPRQCVNIFDIATKALVATVDDGATSLDVVGWRDHTLELHSREGLLGPEPVQHCEYDLSSGQLSRGQVKPAYRADVKLAPDGKHAAVLVDGVLEVHDLVASTKISRPLSPSDARQATHTALRWLDERYLVLNVSPCSLVDSTTLFFWSPFPRRRSSRVASASPDLEWLLMSNEDQQLMRLVRLNWSAADPHWRRGS